jgi:hypothetical protein
MERTDEGPFFVTRDSQLQLQPNAYPMGTDQSASGNSVGRGSSRSTVDLVDGLKRFQHGRYQIGGPCSISVTVEAAVLNRCHKKRTLIRPLHRSIPNSLVSGLKTLSVVFCVQPAPATR